MMAWRFASIIGLHGGFVVRRAVAEDPDAWLVVEVRLDVEAIDALLGGVGQAQAVLIEIVDELALGRGVGIDASAAWPGSARRSS